MALFSKFLIRLPYKQEAISLGGLSHHSIIINTCCLTTIIAIIEGIVIGPRPFKNTRRAADLS